MAKKTRIEMVNKPRKKNPPRTAFKKGEENPHAFKPGESGNPGGKPKEHRLLSKALRMHLANRAPDSVCEALNLPHHSSWAQCVGMRLIRLAITSIDTNAIRAVHEISEGSRSRLEIVDESDACFPSMEIVFVESDGNGRPHRYSAIESSVDETRALPQETAAL